jgi:hypothetical protein
MDPTLARQRGGRPRADAAVTVRNRIWAWEVRSYFCLSWDKLDAEFLPPTETKDAHRHRAFWNIAQFGLEPRSSMRKQTKVDLVLLVAARPGAKYTQDLYDSPLWEMLKPPGVTVERLIELKRLLLERRGLFEANKEEMSAGRWVFPKARAFRNANRASRRRSIARLVKSATLDDIALLVIQFRLSMALIELDEAKDYYNALLRVFEVQHDVPRGWQFLYGALHTLVRARLILGDWGDEVGSLLNLSARVRSKHSIPLPKPLLPQNPRTQLFSSLFTKRLDEDPQRANMVPIDSRVRWFQKHREAILHDRGVAATQSAFTDPDMAELFGMDKVQQKNLLFELRSERPPAPYEELARWGLPSPDGYEVD